MEKQQNISLCFPKFMNFKSLSSWSSPMPSPMFSVFQDVLKCITQPHQGHTSQFVKVTEKPRKWNNSQFIFISSHYKLKSYSEKANVSGRPNNKNIMTMENQSRLKTLNISYEIFIEWNHSNGLKNKRSVPDFWSFVSHIYLYCEGQLDCVTTTANLLWQDADSSSTEGSEMWLGGKCFMLHAVHGSIWRT